MTFSFAPRSRRATFALLVTATLLAGACSDDESSTLPSDEGDVDGELDPGEGGPGDGQSATDDVDLDGDDSATAGDDAEQDGNGETGGLAIPVVPPGRDDRPGLVVRFPGDREPGALVSPWLAIVNAFQVAPNPVRGSALNARLLRYEDGLDFSTSADFFTPELEICDVRTRDEDATDGEDGGGNRAPRIDGGTLTLSSAGGVWLSVPFSEETEVYEVDRTFPGPAPDDLTLSLPGAAFPRIDALPLFVPGAPERLSPAVDEPVTTTTEYRWMADGDTTSMRIVFQHFVDGEFVDFPIVCDVIDDGDFELPDDAAAALAALPGTTTIRYARRHARLDFLDGVAVYGAVTIADD